MMFRNLRADEIELRVGTATEKGFSLLLYKDARCDMNILDETVGAMNWRRSHSRENANCIVSIWDPDKSEWVSKEDTGAESFTEKEKGLASDSFKRACVNWGIGRELYTAPFIWVKGHTKQGNNGKYKTDGFDRDLTVSVIEYDDNNTISNLIITDKTQSVVYKFGEKEVFFEPVHDRDALITAIELAISKGLNRDKVLAKAKISTLDDLPTERLDGMLKWLNSLDETKRKELM